MTEAAIKDEVSRHLARLPPELQRQVLDFVREVDRSPLAGVDGSQLLRFCGILGRVEAASMIQAIDAECERVQPNEW